MANPAIREVFAASLAAAHERFGFALFAWVVMPEHAHLLIRPRDGVPLDRALLCIKLSVSQRVIHRWRELDAPILKKIQTPVGSLRFWQRGGGFDRNVRHEGEFAKEVRYIHRNPVERELVKRPQDWAWSSAPWWLGDLSGPVPCDQPEWIEPQWNRLHV